MDYFSRWPEAVALKDEKTLTTAKRLFETVVIRHGCPKAIDSKPLFKFHFEIIQIFLRKI